MVRQADLVLLITSLLGRAWPQIDVFPGAHGRVPSAMGAFSLLPRPQHLRHGPHLRNAPSRRVGRVPVKDLAASLRSALNHGQAAHAVRIQLLDENRQKRPRQLWTGALDQIAPPLRPNECRAAHTSTPPIVASKRDQMSVATRIGQRAAFPVKLGSQPVEGHCPKKAVGSGPCLS